MNAEVKGYTPDGIMVAGMRCLVDGLGHINAPSFINSVRASCPDYIRWRRKMYDCMTLDGINAMVVDDAEDNPFEIRSNETGDDSTAGAKSP